MAQSSKRTADALRLREDSLNHGKDLLPRRLRVPLAEEGHPFFVAAKDLELKAALGQQRGN